MAARGAPHRAPAEVSSSMGRDTRMKCALCKEVLSLRGTSGDALPRNGRSPSRVPENDARGGCRCGSRGAVDARSIRPSRGPSLRRGPPLAVFAHALPAMRPLRGSAAGAQGSQRRCSSQQRSVRGARTRPESAARATKPSNTHRQTQSRLPSCYAALRKPRPTYAAGQPSRVARPLRYGAPRSAFKSSRVGARGKAAASRSLTSSSSRIELRPPSLSDGLSPREPDFRKLPRNPEGRAPGAAGEDDRASVARFNRRARPARHPRKGAAAEREKTLDHDARLNMMLTPDAERRRARKGGRREKPGRKKVVDKVLRRPLESPPSRDESRTDARRRVAGIQATKGESPTAAWSLKTDSYVYRR